MKHWKNLKSIFAGIALLFACAATNAAVKADQRSQSDVVKTYIEDISKSKTTDLDKVLAPDMHFNMQRGQNVNTLDKDDLIKSLQSATSNQPVNTDSTIMQQEDNSAKIKVVFKYDGYTRTDVVTVAKVYGWQVTNVDSSYN